MDQNPAASPLNPNALTLVDAAKLLSKVGGCAFRLEMLQADVAAGAPVNPDGTLNLVHYAAWLTREGAGHDGCP